VVVALEVFVGSYVLHVHRCRRDSRKNDIHAGFAIVVILGSSVAEANPGFCPLFFCDPEVPLAAGFIVLLAGPAMTLMGAVLWQGASVALTSRRPAIRPTSVSCNGSKDWMIARMTCRAHLQIRNGLYRDPHFGKQTSYDVRG
jgi:hypothetical protein